MKTMQEITPVEYQYYVRNLYEVGHPILFDSLAVAKSYILRQVRSNYWDSNPWEAGTNVAIRDLIADSPIRYRHYWFKLVEKPSNASWRVDKMVKRFAEGSYPFLVTNQFGAIISYKEIDAVDEEWMTPYNRTPWVCPPKELALSKARLTNKKNVNKIKDFHRTQLVVNDSRYGYGMEEIDDVYGWWCRSPSTYAEMRQTEGHNTEDEDGFIFGRASRSARYMPQWWDDEPVAAKRQRTSWKTNSKRKKQWKMRDLTSL